MEIRVLRYFLEIARAGNMTRAAETLHLSQPTLSKQMKEFKQKYPLFRYHLTSGNTEQVTERLDRGLIDFAVIVEPPNLSRYSYLEIPEADVWGSS